MANTKELDDAIERMREDKDCPEGLLEMLVELREGISETASEAEVEEIVRKALVEYRERMLDCSTEVVLSEEDSDYMEKAVNTAKELFLHEGWNYSEARLRNDLHLFELGVVFSGCSIRRLMILKGLFGIIS